MEGSLGGVHVLAGHGAFGVDRLGEAEIPGRRVGKLRQLRQVGLRVFNETGFAVVTAKGHELAFIHGGLAIRSFVTKQQGT